MEFVLVILFTVIYVWYLVIVARKNKVKEAYLGIERHLKKRADLIPNVLNIAGRFMQHEQDLMQEVAKLRTDILNIKTQGLKSTKERFVLEGLLENKISALMLCVENYPDLKSNKAMLDIQEILNRVENNIESTRNSYNLALTDLKNITQIFPGSLIAQFLKIDSVVYFDIPELDRQIINARKHFN